MDLLLVGTRAIVRALGLPNQRAIPRMKARGAIGLYRIPGRGPTGEGVWVWSLPALARALLPSISAAGGGDQAGEPGPIDESEHSLAPVSTHSGSERSLTPPVSPHFGRQAPGAGVVLGGRAVGLGPSRHEKRTPKRAQVVEWKGKRCRHPVVEEMARHPEAER